MMKRFMTPVRRAITARSTVETTTVQRVSSVSLRTAETRALVRAFSSEPTIRRPKAVKVKKSEARRRVDSKLVAESNALVEQQEHAQVPAEYNQSGPLMPQQGPTTFGGMMKESFFWGIGMAIAFTFVGVIFGRMEETEAPGAYEESHVVADEQENDHEHA